MIPGMPYLEAMPGSGPSDSVWGKLGKGLGTITGLGELASRSLRRRARLTKEHLVSHTYTYLMAGFIDAACYTHSLFSGLLVTGISFAVLEWKASDEPQRSE